MHVNIPLTLLTSATNTTAVNILFYEIYERQHTLLAEVFYLVGSISYPFPARKKNNRKQGRKTVAVKTVMKRLGDRSDQIKNLC